MLFHPNLSFESTEQQEDFQNTELKKLLSYLQSHSPFYKTLFQQHKTDPDKITSIADLPLIPTTSKSDMQQNNWDFLCVPKNEIKEYTATSGTLGKPVTITLTHNDLERLAYNEQQSFLCADGQPEDIYQLMLTLDRQFMAGMAYYSGIRKMGASLVRTGPGLPSIQLETMMRLGTTAIVAVPSFILKLIAYAKENGIDLNKLPVQKAVCIGEGLRDGNFEWNTLAKRIREEWNIELYSTYASTEMQTAFTDCSAGNGGHLIPDLIITEILDEEGNQLAAGEYGELTITTLGVEGMPLLRYRTGDICAYYESPCSCGRKSRRLSPVVGRKQQMIKYKGTSVYPPAIFDVLNELSFIKEYVVEAHTNEIGTDDLVIHILTEIETAVCEQQLKPLLQAKLRVSPGLNFISVQEMQEMQFPQTSRKQLKFLDKR